MDSECPTLPTIIYRMQHLYFVQTTKGIWVPGGLYEDKSQAIEDAAKLNADRGALVRAPMGMRLRWKHPRHKAESAMAA